MPIEVRLDDRNVYAPDIRWYREERVPDPGAGAPYPMRDLAVEVRSPSTWRYDVGPKRAGYERHGLPELWLVDTLARTVLVYRRSAADAAGFDVSLELAEDETLSSPLLPGFAIGVRAEQDLRLLDAHTRLGTFPLRVKTARIALWPKSAVGPNMHGQPPSITSMSCSRP